jgi:hypothetical protein
MSLPNPKTGAMISNEEYDPQVHHTAEETLLSNNHINNLVFHDDHFRDRMRQIQAKYNVKHYHCSDKGYCFQIQLLWDHDRLWGKFQFKYFKGVFLVNPGPGQNHFHADEEYCQLKQYLYWEGEQEPATQREPTSATWEYPFIWRGTSTLHSNVLNSPSNVGKIRFGFRDISGHFDGMPSMNLQGDRCEFHGKHSIEDALVPVSVQDIIDEWHEHGISTEGKPRPLSSQQDEVIANEKKTEPTSKSSPSITTPMEWTECSP